MKNLDKTELKILQQLDLNARATLKSIGKYCNRSPETVAYRIAKLFEKGFIQEYHTVVNLFPVGYGLYKCYFNVRNIQSDKLDSLISFLGKQPAIGNIATTSGTFDIEIGIVAKSNTAFYNEVKNIEEQFSEYFAKKQVSILTKVYGFNRKYLFDKKKTQTSVCEEKEEVAEIDLKLLKTFIEKPNISILDAAKRCNLSRTTVIQKLKDLQKNKIIQGFTVVLDHSKLNLKKYRLFVTATPTIAKKLYAYCLESRNITNLQECLASWDFEIELELEGTDQLYHETMKLKNSIPEIKEITHHEIVKVYNYKFSFE